MIGSRAIITYTTNQHALLCLKRLAEQDIRHDGFGDFLL